MFNLFGWIWKKTRLANLITLGLTGASWFILGIFYGIGYCPLTDWHWQVLIKLGKSNIPNSYVKYLIDRIFGGDIDAQIVDYSTVVLYFLALDKRLLRIKNTSMGTVHCSPPKPKINTASRKVAAAPPGERNPAL